MTQQPARAIAAFAVLLVVLSGAVYLVQRSWFAPGRELPPGPPPAAPPAVAVPVAATQGPAAQAAPEATAPGVPVIDQRWLDRTASAAGVPVVALRAYARAELEAPPGCGLGWTTLAGIGWIESQHGTLGDRTLGEDGRSSSPILGPALDGAGGFKAIPATPESEQWHGDPEWDHAFGPMQFISSTWASWETDGDGDGVADPNDLDDAALAAARYLCADGHDLTTAEGWTAAILSYNNSRDYLDSVHAAATTYAERTSP